MTRTCAATIQRPPTDFYKNFLEYWSIGQASSARSLRLLSEQPCKLEHLPDVVGRICFDLRVPNLRGEVQILKNWSLQAHEQYSKESRLESLESERFHLIFVVY